MYGLVLKAHLEARYDTAKSAKAHAKIVWDVGLPDQTKKD